MLLQSFYFVAAIVAIIHLIILLYLVVEYRLRLTGISQGFFNGTDVKIKSSFSCYHIPFLKCGIWFNEYPIDEFNYHLNVTINLPWFALDYTSDFLK